MRAIRFENPTKNADIFHPTECYTAVRLAAKDKPVYSVVELETKNVKDFKKLARENITPTIVEANGVPVHI